MKWLVTFDQETAIGDVQARLQQWHCNVLADTGAIPLGESEVVIEVEGPQNLPQLAASSDLDIKVYPSSKVEPF